MKKPEVFRNTIDVLVNAFFDGTLMPQHCAACAVGNVLADANDMTVVEDPYKSYRWKGGQYNIWSTSLGPHEIVRLNDNVESPYSGKELAMIERAFEENTSKVCHSSEEEKMEDMFDGLMAVVDVLEDIHEVDDTKDVRDQFRSHPALA